MAWFSFGAKKTIGLDPTNPSDADLIANAYCKVLKEHEHHPVFRPLAALPYPKEQIATALRTDVLSMRDPEFTSAAGVVYVQLAGFLPEEDAAIAARMDGGSIRLSSDIGDRSLSSGQAQPHGRHAEILAFFNAETNRLKREWQAFIERNKLELPKDVGACAWWAGR